MWNVCVSSIRGRGRGPGPVTGTSHFTSPNCNITLCILNFEPLHIWAKMHFYCPGDQNFNPNQPPPQINPKTSTRIKAFQVHRCLEMTESSRVTQSLPREDVVRSKWKLLWPLQTRKPYTWARAALREGWIDRGLPFVDTILDAY